MTQFEFLPDLAKLSPAHRKAWAERTLSRCGPGRPMEMALAADLLVELAQEELSRLRVSHPELFPDPKLEL